MPRRYGTVARQVAYGSAGLAGEYSGGDQRSGLAAGV
jgi:hypothetical protein